MTARSAGPKPRSTQARAAGAASIAALRARAAGCRACPLWTDATQTVFSEGPDRAPLMLVGEVPGDVEDRRGRPFVGPAGKLLDEVLAELGLDRAKLYLTNAVKHFKWVPAPRGKRRLHVKPAYGEVEVCSGWLHREVALVRPAAIVCLGAVAAHAFHGSSYRMTAQRGAVLETPWSWLWMATYHPAALLRMPTPDSRRAARRAFTGDLERVSKAIGVL